MKVLRQWDWAHHLCTGAEWGLEGDIIGKQADDSFVVDASLPRELSNLLSDFFGDCFKEEFQLFWPDEF